MSGTYTNEEQTTAGGLDEETLLDKAYEVAKKAMPPKTKEFIASPAGQQFLANATNLRAIYELSLAEGLDNDAKLDCLRKVFPEQMASVDKFMQTDPDISKATLKHLVRVMNKVHTDYPKLATSTNYVIKPVKILVKDPTTGKDVEDYKITYVDKSKLSDEDKKKTWPETTGQYIQMVANVESENGNNLHARDLYPYVADAMGKDEDYPSMASNTPMVDAMFLERSGNMMRDDELRTKAGGFGKAVVGDVIEGAVNLANPLKVAKAVSYAPRVARGVVNAVNGVAKSEKAQKVANTLGNTAKGIEGAVDKVARIGEGNIWLRGLKGGAGNVAQTGAVDAIGNTYDAFAGTDRGANAISTDNLAGLGVDFLLGAIGKGVANPSEANLARAELWKKINKNDWGRQMLKEREAMGKPWLYASDIDPEWMKQYLGSRTYDDFARDAYNGKEFPDIRLKQSANPIENEQNHIDAVNAKRMEQNQAIKARNDAMDERAKEYRDYMDEREYGLKDWQDQQNIANASDKLDESAEAVEKQEQNVANLEQKIANEKEERLGERWNEDLGLHYDTDNARKTANSTQLSQPHYQQPYTEHQPTFVPKKSVKLANGTVLQLGELDGKPASRGITPDGKVGNAVPLSYKEAMQLNTTAGTKYMDTKSIPPTNMSKQEKVDLGVVHERGVNSLPTISDEFDMNFSDFTKPRDITYEDALNDVANRGRMQNAVEVLGNRKEALNKATADYNSAVEQSLKAPEQRVIGVDEYRATHPQHEDYIPMMKNVEFETDKIISGNTDSRTWERICQSNWQRLGYKSAEDMRINMPIESRKALAQQMEQSLRDQGWREGIGAHQWYSAKDWNRHRAERAEPKEQSKALKEQSYDNSANKYQHDLMTKEYEFPEGTPQSTYKDFENTNKEFGMRMNAGKSMGGYGGARASTGALGKIRGIGGWLIPTIGREEASADYDFQGIPKNVRIPVDPNFAVTKRQQKK